MGIEQKPAQAAQLIEDVSGEFEKSGLYVSFEIKITARPQSVGIEIAPLRKKAPVIIEDIPTELLGLTLREFGNRYAETEQFQRHIRMIEQLIAVEEKTMARDQRRLKVQLQEQQALQAQSDTPSPAQSSQQAI
jgi:hypothetical protein